MVLIHLPNTQRGIISLKFFVENSSKSTVRICFNTQQIISVTFPAFSTLIIVLCQVPHPASPPPFLNSVLYSVSQSYCGLTFLLQVVCRQPPVLSLWRCHLSPGRLCGVASVRTGLVSTDDGDSAFCYYFCQTLTGIQCCQTQGAMFTPPTSPTEKSLENVLLVFMSDCLCVMFCFRMD